MKIRLSKLQKGDKKAKKLRSEGLLYGSKDIDLRLETIKNIRSE